MTNIKKENNNAKLQVQSEQLNIDFDKLSEDLGRFGRYQILVFLLGCFASYISGLAAALTVFTAYNNPRRCFIEGCDSANSTYEEEFLNYTTPFDKKNEVFDECSMYSSQPDNATFGCLKDDFDEFQVVNCTEWVYDTEIFTSTLVTTFDLVCNRSFLAPLAGTFFLGGMIFGSVGIGAISDKFGRKIGLMVSVMLYGLCLFGCAISPNYIMFLILSAFAGAGGTALYQTAFIIAIELVSSKWRGFCGVMILIPFALGEVTTGIFAYFIRDWRYIEIALAATASILFSYYWVMPESIHWMVSQNKIEEAKQLVDKVAKINKVQSPSKVFDIDIQRNESKTKNAEIEGKPQKKSVLMLMKLPNMRKRTLILIYCWCVCSLAYYGLSVNTGNLPGNIFVSYLLTMLVEVPSYFLIYYLLDKIGRKGNMVTVFLIGGISCLTSALLPQDQRWLVLSFSLLGKFGIAGAFGAIYLFSAELYPTEYRGLAVGTCSMCSRVAGSLAPLIASLSSYYQPLPLLIFGSLSFLAGCLIITLPETLGKKLPQTVEESEAFGKNESSLHFICCGSTVEKKN